MLRCIEGLCLYVCLQVWTTESRCMRIYIYLSLQGAGCRRREGIAGVSILQGKQEIQDLCYSSKITSSLEAEASFFIVFTSLMLTAFSSSVKPSADFVLRDSSLGNGLPRLLAPTPALSHNCSCLWDVTSKTLSEQPSYCWTLTEGNQLFITWTGLEIQWCAHSKIRSREGMYGRCPRKHLCMVCNNFVFIYTVSSPHTREYNNM